jgi:hypothetical protein
MIIDEATKEVLDYMLDKFSLSNTDSRLTAVFYAKRKTFYANNHSITK